MCGIAGYVTTAADTCPQSILERMTGVIAHRGPDGCGYFRDGHAALGHRRLSIIDLAGGAQPMYNEDRRLVVVYNGEIFNYAALREPLEQAGHRFASRCDTETILHAYEEFGPDSLTRYRGMFSFVIWDRCRRELFGARDRLGIKPFYYFWDGRTFVFGSEIKALLEHPSVTARLDESGLPEYLACGYRSGEDTLFQGIRQLMPGHWLKLSLDGGAPRLDIRCYWDAPVGAAESGGDEEELVADCRRRLEETVRLRLMSDVPLGMFLSGGVDSSAMAALMTRLTNGPVKTFAVGYSEAAYSELAYARQVAEHIGTHHHEVVVSAADFFEALPRLIWHEDEPITWPSSVSLYFVSRLAASEVKVVLTGEGSDELFGGYARYRHYQRSLDLLRYYSWVPGALRSWLRNWISWTSVLNGEWRRKLQHTILGRAGDLESLYLDNFYSAFSLPEQRRLLVSSLPGSAYAGFQTYWQRTQGAPLLARLLYADQKTYLVELLRKQDRMSMACSIESRVPFLDHTFVEFAGRLPARLKIRGATTKYIIKRAVADLLPAPILHRRKMGFPTPLAEWLRGPHGVAAARVLSDSDGLLARYVDASALESLLAAHRAGREDHTDRIWRLLNIQLWADLFLTGRRERYWEGFLATPVPH